MKSNWKKRLLSLLTLALIVLPMTLLTVYASSPKYDFAMNFNAVGGTIYCEGTKTDMGESTQGTAGVTVEGGNFNNSSVRFKIVDTAYTPLTNSRNVSTATTISLTYISGVLEGTANKDVYLAGTNLGTVWSIGGKFQP